MRVDLSLPERILTCLEAAGFRTGTTPLLPLGQPLPLVSAWAISDETGTLALVAEPEAEDGWQDEPWRELFFALASLRHELRRGRGSAFGTPVILAALREEAGAERLRALAEELSRDYLLFTRLELNVIVDTPGVDIEVALAPLLPRTRRAIREGEIVGVEVLARLADELREQIAAAANELEDVQLRPLAASAADQIAEDIATLVEVDLTAQTRPTPIQRITLRNFRAFRDLDLPLAPFTLLEGLNGTGKSSLIEALEIAWTGSSLRRPPRVGATDFDRHLSYRGTESWKISAFSGRKADPQDVTATLAEPPKLVLGRTVFATDAARDIASDAPEERFAEFLRVVGLHVPELPRAAEELRQSAKRDLNTVLERFGIAPVPRVDTPAARHVRDQLARRVRVDASAWTAVSAAEETLRAAAHGEALQFRLPILLAGAGDSRLEQLGSLAAKAAPDLAATSEYVSLARKVAADFEAWAEESEAYASTLDLVLARAFPSALPEVPGEPLAIEAPSDQPAPLSRPTARSWLFAARTLQQSVQELDRQLGAVDDRDWHRRLEAFLELARAAVDATPFKDLEAAQNQPSPEEAPAPRRQLLDPELLETAGFADASERHELPRSLIEPLTQLRNDVRSLAGKQREVERAVITSPLIRLEGSERELRAAVARSELVRQIQGPLARAQQNVLDALFSKTLRSVLIEMIMALTRFEWYFGPPTIDVREKSVHIGGMATDEAELDVRMLLNAGERSIVTLAWFLALHILQPEAARTTLVLDDPFSHLDSTNQASAIATIRSLVRLTRPELFIFSCHDPALADTASAEFAEFNGWPSSRARYRFARKPDGTATATSVAEPDGKADLTGELARITQPAAVTH